MFCRLFLFSTFFFIFTKAIEYRIGIVHGNDGTLPFHHIRHAISQWNAETSGLRLSAIAASDPFAEIDDRWCDIVQRRLVGMIIPVDGLSDDQLSLAFSMCDRFHIPCLTTANRLIKDWGFVHSVGPRVGIVGRAVAQLISRFAWSSFLLVYERSIDLVEVTDLLAAFRNEHGTQTNIRVLQLPKTFDRYDSFLKYAREKLKQTSLVIHSSNIGIVHEILIRAAELNMTESRYSYFFTHPDLSLLDDFLDDGRFQCNISGVRLVQSAIQMKTSLALALDSIRLFGTALSRFRPRAVSILCDAGDIWADGKTMDGALRSVTAHTHTGIVRIGDPNVRTNSSLIGVTRSDGHFTQIGVWTEADNRWDFDEKYENTWKFKRIGEQIDLSGAKLRVVVYLEEPFVIRVEDSDGIHYDGFCIDLLKEMATVLNFTYEIVEVEDGTYGVQDETGRWNGIIGVLQRHEADLSVSAVTISYSRVRVIDFTLPFMHLGIAILMSNKGSTTIEHSQTGLFTFLEPLSFSVWITLFLAYLTVAFTMCLVARFSPYEWFDIQQIDERDRSMDNHKNQFTIFNSLWFAIGSLMQQGSDVIPRAVATRTVAVMWWLFTLITISSYTAQLAAFLTVERMSTSVENAMDLASQSRIKFGTLKNGSTMDFFRESKIPIYERMWSVMQSTSPTVFVNSSKEGITRVKAGNYAYMMESTMIEFYKGHDCALETIGGLLDSKGYGVAVPKGSPLRDVLSKTILQLQERTILEALKNRWWMSKQETRNCPAAADTHSSLKRVYGVFGILFAGIGLAILVSIGEYFVESKNPSPRLDFTLLGKLSAWMYKRKQPQTMSGLRQRLQMHEGLFSAIPVGNLWLLDQRRAAMENRQAAAGSSSQTTQSPSSNHLEPTSPSSNRERTPSREEIRKLSRLLTASSMDLLNRRISNAHA